MIVYQCEDSLESIFTAIYNAYEEKRNHRDALIQLNDDLQLFAEYVKVDADWNKAAKVMRTLERQFGEENYMWLCYALASPAEDKAQAVYQTVVEGLQRKAAKGHLFDNLANSYVNRAFVLARGANGENLHYRGFVRFAELDNGILYSKFEPKNNIITFLMPHFADRFPMENFMLYDGTRGLLGIHPAGRQWYLVQGSEDPEEMESFGLSDKEKVYADLFRYFCYKIGIEERKNLKLQRNMLPLRFRANMVEFQR